MLNISENTIKDIGLQKRYPSFKKIQKLSATRKLAYWVTFAFILLISVSFLPWTQNIRTKGKVTTLRPEDRPQSIYPVVPGRIEQWYVIEGDTVQPGDTLARLSEIKTEYFDPNLLNRVDKQVKAKEMSRKSYTSKADAISKQLQAMQNAMELKLEQAENKVRQAKLKITTDSIAFETEKVAYDIAEYQFRRADTLYNQRLISLTKWEAKRNKLQEVQAKLIDKENKLLLSQNDMINARIELNRIRNETADKMAKAESERFASLSSAASTEADLTKLESTKSSYEQRIKNYYVLAPQAGLVTKVYKQGIGEIVKDGDPLLSLMPLDAEMAVQIYVRPMDYPLLELNQPVIFAFDGWPAFYFSGWPEQSAGMFRGRIYAIDNMTSENNLFRVLVIPDPNVDKKWPSGLRVGTAANGTVLLKNVSLWYEVWRQLNGFPPDFYNVDVEEVKLKAPANHLKK